MLAVVHLHWEAVSEGQWSQVRTLLNTGQLAPQGCLSCHVRRTGRALHVQALWDDAHGAQIFARGHLEEVLRAAGLDDPEVTHVPLRGFYALGQRPAANAEPVGRSAPVQVMTLPTAA